MIYTVAQIRVLIPALTTKSDPQVVSYLDQSEVDILFILKKTVLPHTEEDGNIIYPTGIKVACRLLIEGYLDEENRKGMTSFRQGSIQVQYDDSDKVVVERDKKIKQALSPFFTVQIWS